MAVSTADALAIVVTTSWTGAQGDALRQALRMPYEVFAAHLGIGVRTVTYWRERPGSVPQQRTQEILDAALEQASQGAKARFAQLVAEAHSEPSDKPGLKQPYTQGTAQELVGLPGESGHDGALLDDLVGADMANRPDVGEASWLPGMAPAVITGHLFTAPTWQHEEQPLIVPGSNVGTRDSRPPRPRRPPRCSPTR
jgi:DNA-binding transcriptional regulator YiaG